SFLDAGQGDASCLGPLAGLEKQRSQYREAVAALADPQRTRLVLVTRAQRATLEEAARTSQELAGIGLLQQHLVINGVLPAAAVQHDDLAAAVYAREQAAIEAMPAPLVALPKDQVTLKAFNVVGLEALRHLLSDAALDADEPNRVDVPKIEAPDLASLVDGIAADGHGLVMVMGKGGVGKTTLAAAIAVNLAERGLAVHLTTSDPAAHLARTLEGTLPNLTVSRIDPRVETERYQQYILATKGAKLDAHGKALLEEDLRSPCTEEIAVFGAFSRIVREAGTKFVIMDTAPTGHTLLLLDATGAYHRDIARQMSGSNVHYTTPMMQLQDPTQTKVLLVTLAETTPVLEAAILQEDLRRAGIEPWAWLVNSSIAAAGPTSALLCQRAFNELREMDGIAKLHAKRYAVVPLLKSEPVGIERLRQLASHHHDAAPSLA
ncbi:arsenical pump-driving ATPase, partial [Pseudomonas aeruginosa]|nr:arsenical pump-driving ATPase [Pseudomonas aeruginosa]